MHSSCTTLKAKRFISQPKNQTIITLNLNQTETNTNQNYQMVNGQFLSVGSALMRLKRFDFKFKVHETENNKIFTNNHCFFIKIYLSLIYKSRVLRLLI